MRFVFPAWPLASAFTLLLGLAACTNGQKPNTAGPAGPALYDRLGGKPVLVAVVDDFFATVGADSRIARRFANADNTHFKAALVEQLCVSTGGPCHTAGPSMKDAHAGLGISDAEFNSMTQDLRHSMDRQGISVENQVAFAAALEPLRDDVVSPLPPTETVVTLPAARRATGHSGPIRRVSGHRPAPKGRAVVKKATTHRPAPGKQKTPGATNH